MKKYRTYKGWLKNGRHVRKGQKCSKVKHGKYGKVKFLFHISQTNSEDHDYTPKINGGVSVSGGHLPSSSKGLNFNQHPDPEIDELQEMAFF